MSFPSDQDLFLGIACQRVALGDEYLTAELPGYEAYVNLDEMNMVSGYRCLLAQLYSNDPRLAAIEPTHSGETDYIAVLRHFIGYNPDERASVTWDVERGFHTAWLADGVEYVHLEIAWRELLMQRQAQLGTRPGSSKAPAPMTDAEDEAFGDEYERRLSGE